MQTFHDVLKQRTPNIGVTKLLIGVNCIVFIAMLISGAGFWHSPNGVQLTWGANFGPATQDGEWWRLASAMFLHFGALHLLLNMWSLWDAGQLVERMVGHLRFSCIYITSGLSGNLVSLVMHGNSAVSGGASGAIFGIYGAALIYLWRERAAITPHEFRWLFWGALGFSVVTIVLGIIVPGIDNSAHIGGFIAGMLTAIVFSKPINIIQSPIKITSNALATITLTCTVLTFVVNIPPPKYRWSDEILLRNQIGDFLYQDQAINRTWLEIVHDSKQGNVIDDELAGRIISDISQPYEESFERLSSMPSDPNLPSASQLGSLLQYAQQRKSESDALAESLRSKK